ncbi:MAG: YHS domain-containing protein [Calditrichae bacterium]|nr:YHS domain-containing protein [Calditrichia bacterium]
MSHHVDPVCGKRMNVNKAHIVITYEGEDYFLCCPLCQKEFERNPHKYVTKKPKKRGNYHG